NRYILKSAEELEQYFTAMKQLLSSGEQQGERECFPVEQVKNLFLQQAQQLQRSYPMEISLQEGSAEGILQVDKTSDVRPSSKHLGNAEGILQVDKTSDVRPSSKHLGNAEGILQVDKIRILRAWNNLLENAMEYTDRERGIRISFEMREQEMKKYWIAGVEDYGRGFSEAELRHGTEEFYRGDGSRSGREHQGLGLAIAEKFAAEEGGFLRLYNSAETGGAAAELWLPVCDFAQNQK
ncbi:MAG: ATP-binding protein, partial [Roseburia sp.]|nr:ATP-binding protein [Roseburia sp.]